MMGDLATLTVLGSLNLDIVIRTERLPRRGETVAALDVSRHPGGKGANQAAAAALAGGRVLMIGAVGQDESGDVLLAAMKDSGVDGEAIARLEGVQTGTAYVMVETGGENQILVHGGANLRVTPAMADIPDGALRLAQLETPLEAVTAFLSRPGALRMLNAAPFVAAARSLFPHVDILIVNETELADYAGAAEVPAGPAAAEALARRLLCRDGQVVVVTLGPAGVVAVGAGETLMIKGRPAQVVDTTGAGDCFCGVLAQGLAAGRTLRDALEHANAAAAISVTRLGAISSMPSAAEIAAAVGGGSA
jgi:ribokinase